MKKIIKNITGTYEITFHERVWKVCELDCEGKPFVFLGIFYYLEDAERMLEEMDKEHRKLLQSMLDSGDPVYTAYAKMVLEDLELETV